MCWRLKMLVAIWFIMVHHINSSTEIMSAVFVPLNLTGYQIDAPVTTLHIVTYQQCLLACLTETGCTAVAIADSKCVLFDGTISPSAGTDFAYAYRILNDCQLPPGIPANVNITGLSLQPSGFIKFSCNRGHLPATSEMTSNDNCDWTGSWPTCESCYDWQDNCYYINIDDMDWDTADQHCRDKGGNLTQILSETENQFILDSIQSVALKPSSYDAFWIGGRRDATDTFRWVADGQEITYEHFHSTEPNRPTDEKCLGMWNHISGWNYDWGDGPCAFTLGYICKVPISVV